MADFSTAFASAVHANRPARSLDTLRISVVLSRAGRRVERYQVRQLIETMDGLLTLERLLKREMDRIQRIADPSNRSHHRYDSNQHMAAIEQLDRVQQEIEIRQLQSQAA